MPDRTTSQPRTKGAGKTNNAGGSRPTDRRTGAGVNRLASTTHKVTLKDSKTNVAAKKSSSNTVVQGSNRPSSKRSSTKVTASSSDGAIKRSPSKENSTLDDTPAIDNTEQPQEENGVRDGVVEGGNESQNEAGQEKQNGDKDDTSDEDESKKQPRRSRSSHSFHEEQKLPEKKPFDIKLFTFTIHDLADKFGNDKYTKVSDDYPVEDLVALIAEVNGAVEHYKQHTLSCQQQLEVLRDRMTVVRDNIHDSVQTKTFEARQDIEPTVEQKELAAKLARINSEVAHANIELARLVKISAETESIAMEAAQSAAHAKEEAEQAKAETEWRQRKAAEKKADDERREIEEEKQRQIEVRREEEARRKHEHEWKKRESSGNIESSASWEEWEPYVYEVRDFHGSSVIGCIIRGDPEQFSANRVTCDSLNQLESSFTVEENEELVSPILALEPNHEGEQLTAQVYVAVPFTANRASMISREAVIKAEVDGEWQELMTREVSFEEHKEYRFAQAEISEYTALAVVSRFKRDYITLTRRTSKVAFSADQRVTMKTSRGSFNNKELLMLQVQPVDSNTVHELKTRDLDMRGLLNSSPIVTTKWERNNFKNTVVITVPCPPNPAKAKKLAAMRAAKEAKMTQAVRNIPDPLDVQEKKEKKKLNRKPNEPEEDDEPVRRTETRWYMGIYGGSDDDENDNLYLLHRFPSGRWAVIPDTNFHQVKLDVLQFELEQPVERFMILRTRTNVDESMAPTMATTLEAALAKRSVKVVLRQRLDDPFEAIAQLVPNSRIDKTLKQLQEDGFEEGPKVCPDVSVREGDIIELGFRGNLRNGEERSLQVPFNSNMSASLEFSLTETDKYLQKNFSVFRGFVQFFRKSPIIKKLDPRAKVEQKTDDDDEAPEPEPVEYERELLAEVLVNIPKYHIETSFTPAKAPLGIVSSEGPVNDDLVHHLAQELGDEWYRLAQHLDIRHSRVQAILQNTHAHDEGEEMAKYEMIMTWLKRAPKASNKVDTLSVALLKTGRNDLADDVRRSYQHFKDHSRKSVESRA